MSKSRELGLTLERKGKSRAKGTCVSSIQALEGRNNTTLDLKLAVGNRVNGPENGKALRGLPQRPKSSREETKRALKGAMKRV